MAHPECGQVPACTSPDDGSCLLLLQSCLPAKKCIFYTVSQNKSSSSCFSWASSQGNKKSKLPGWSSVPELKQSSCLGLGSSWSSTGATALAPLLMCVCACMTVCVTCLCLQRSEESAGRPGTGHEMPVRTRPQSCAAASAPNLSPAGHRAAHSAAHLSRHLKGRGSWICVQVSQGDTVSP